MARPPVPLPSIRDIFPEMASQPPRDDKFFHPPPSPPPSSSSSSESAARPPPKQPPYSFNVLRADPVTASLEHVASSTTLRPRAASSAAAAATSHPGMHGAAPVFRVAIPPGEHRHSRHRPHRSVREILPDTRDRHLPRDALPPSIPREADLAHLHSPSSTILSFPVSDHPVNSTSALITTDGRRVHLRSEIPGAALQGEGRGKKHQCPHCGKRFNRPSSMKIHVNTHTGAKPYRCPFPGCGREFNVNSNMRRHWRNHSRSAPVRLPDPDVARAAVYHSRLQGIPHALMSPPATNSSISDGNSDDDVYSDEEPDAYPMDIDPRPRREHDDEPMDVVCDASLKPSNASSSSSSSDWSRSASPARHPVTAPYAHGQPHRQARSPPRQECIYRPSIPAYALSCTDASVSTALRPAFTSSPRDRYQPRALGGREKRHGYPS